MEVFIRWACPCRIDPCCHFCLGKGYLEQWIPVELLRYFTVVDHFILGRRFTDPPPTHIRIA
jgi:hypothetical protein